MPGEFHKAGIFTGPVKCCGNVAHFCTILLLALAVLGLLLAGLWQGDGTLYRFLYDSAWLATWGLGTGLVALICRRSRARVFAVVAALSLIGVCHLARSVHWLRNWSLVYRFEFKGIEPTRYRWWVGDHRWIDIGSCNRVWFATRRSKDSGAYDLWRVDGSRKEIGTLPDRNAEIVWDPLDPMRVKKISRVSCDAIPAWWRTWDGSDGIDWWKPPADDEDCDCYEWTDQLGKTWPRMLVDYKRGIVWIR